MIIDDVNKVIFVHIPKCAGSTIRQQLERYDTTGNKFTNYVNKTDYDKPIDMTHIPLCELERNFNSTFEKFKQYNSYAVIRDPYKRFSSSLYEHLSMYVVKNIKALSPDEVSYYINEIINKLKVYKDDEILPYQLIHFQKQTTYIKYNDIQVKNIYPSSSVSKLFEDLAKVYNEKSFIDNKNIRENEAVFYKSRNYRFIAKVILPLYLSIGKSIIPDLYKKKLQNMFYIDKSSAVDYLFESEHVKEFIADYYHLDIQAYNSFKK